MWKHFVCFLWKAQHILVMLLFHANMLLYKRMKYRGRIRFITYYEFYLFMLHKFIHIFEIFHKQKHLLEKPLRSFEPRSKSYLLPLNVVNSSYRTLRDRMPLVLKYIVLMLSIRFLKFVREMFTVQMLPYNKNITLQENFKENATLLLAEI